MTEFTLEQRAALEKANVTEAEMQQCMIECRALLNEDHSPEEVIQPLVRLVVKKAIEEPLKKLLSGDFAKGDTLGS